MEAKKGKNDFEGRTIENIQSEHCITQWKKQTEKQMKRAWGTHIMKNIHVIRVLQAEDKNRTKIVLEEMTENIPNLAKHINL